MNWHERTIQTYNDSAAELTKLYAEIGVQKEEIDTGLALTASTSPRVVEIGCGDGRDAAEIVRHAAWYEGFDPSIGLLHIARERLPNTSFVQADALTYDYPEGLDVVYAFASVLHIPRNDLRIVLGKVATALRPGGIFYMTLKERVPYQEEIVQDQYGKRLFCYYNTATIAELAGAAFTLAHESRVPGQTTWLMLALRKSGQEQGTA